MGDQLSKEYMEAWNSYFYPGTEVLKNKLGIYNQDELEQREAEITFERLVELIENPIEGNYDKFHLRAIHKYLFQDVYDWAGEYRTVHMGKNTSSFSPVADIDGALDEEFRLVNEELKQIYDKDRFAMLLTELFINLLNIHPFREGNGRSVREFIREFANAKIQELDFGEYEFDWSKVDDKALDEAMPLARMGSGLVYLQIKKAIVPIEKEDIKKTGL